MLLGEVIDMSAMRNGACIETDPFMLLSEFNTNKEI